MSRLRVSQVLGLSLATKLLDTPIFPLLEAFLIRGPDAWGYDPWLQGLKIRTAPTLRLSLYT
jgi:hypothetical protein